jgi:hypothetical protein
MVYSVIGKAGVTVHEAESPTDALYRATGLRGWSLDRSTGAYKLGPCSYLVAPGNINRDPCAACQHWDDCTGCEVGYMQNPARCLRDE